MSLYALYPLRSLLVLKSLLKNPSQKIPEIKKNKISKISVISVPRQNPRPLIKKTPHH
jgi:hypothetical protein